MPVNAKKAAAALMLSTGSSAVTVAKQLKIAPETISRWKIVPEFQALINEYQTERISVAREQLREASKKAVDTINSLMDSKTETIRLKAAVSLLKLSNIDQPQHLFAGIGSSDPMDILLDMKKQLIMEKNLFPTPYAFGKKRYDLDDDEPS